MLTKNKNVEILGNNSCPQFASPTILLNVEEPFKTTDYPPKIPPKKHDFHVPQISEKTLKDQLLIRHI